MIRTEPFGLLPGGTPVVQYTLTNANGMDVEAITYGGIITSLRVPDHRGAVDDVVLGYDALDGYLKASPYFGAIIGRYGNRIADAQFVLDGEPYELAANDGPHHLHGGTKGFDKAVWHAEPFERADRVGVVFTHTSPDGDEGYPGTVQVTVTYTLTDANELIVDYQATTDQATPINLTQHTYFNLAGDGTGDVLDHRVMINAAHYLPVNERLIPTGELRPVDGTPFDFTESMPIGARIDADDPQLHLGPGGYDHTFVLNQDAPGKRVLATRVVAPATGRVLEVHTTEPGMQFYTGNFLDGTITGKGGHVYAKRTGFCLETQHFPDSPNQPDFPSTILRPGETYRSRTSYAFSTQ